MNRILFILLALCFLNSQAEEIVIGGETYSCTKVSSGYYIEATCWLDDDVEFDSGQYNAGKIYGSSGEEVEKTCAAIAKGKGKDWTSGIADVKQIAGFKSHHLVATCWLDDDVEFDPGQYNAGKIYGNSGEEVEKTCAAIAKGKGKDWTSGLADIIQEEGSISYHIEATCWLDDDVEFDPGQYNAGKLSGKTAEEVEKTCAAIAKGKGKDWTSGLTDIIQVKD